MRTLNILIVSLLLFSHGAYSQEDFKLVKVDNADFPQIEVYIRTDKGIDPNEFIVKEKGTILKISADTIPARDIYKGRSILFIVDEFVSDSVLETLADIILSMNKEDEINIAIFSEAEGMDRLVFLSPEFSNNMLYFRPLLTIETIQKMAGIWIGENCRTIRRIEKNMMLNSDSDKNKAIIIINANLYESASECSGLIKSNRSPVYYIHESSEEIKEHEELIELCTESGGIYTMCKVNEVDLFLRNYLEDIKYAKGDPKTNVYRITFVIVQKKENNEVLLEYKNTAEVINIIRPDKIRLTKREMLFAGISAVFIGICIYLLLGPIRHRQSAQEKNIENKKDKPMTVPIEINVRTKGLNKTYFFEKHIIGIGRSSNNDIIIPDRTVSGNHAVISKEGNDYFIQDMGSTNGVIVNQKKVKKHILSSKDKIKLGSAILVVRM